MTSRLIYAISKRLPVQWIRAGESEWIYCGVLEDIKLDLIISHLNNHLDGSNYYLSVDRNRSTEINKESVIMHIERLIGLEDFSIWDMNFQNVIVFNRIGVFKEGKSNGIKI